MTLNDIQQLVGLQLGRMTVRPEDRLYDDLGAESMDLVNLAVVGLSIVFGMVIGGRLNTPQVAYASPDPTPLRLMPAMSTPAVRTDFADIVEGALPAVVSVTAAQVEAHWISEGFAYEQGLIGGRTLPIWHPQSGAQAAAGSFSAERGSLVESRLSPSGARYRTLETYPLGAPAEDGAPAAGDAQ